jgi:hypothetical protein
LVLFLGVVLFSLRVARSQETVPVEDEILQEALSEKKDVLLVKSVDSVDDITADDVTDKDESTPEEESSNETKPKEDLGDSVGPNGHEAVREEDPVDASADDETSEAKRIVVGDYLESLSNAELEKICLERGFELSTPADGLKLQRKDYVEAARRCLSLEDEMNAILAAHPDLAAELEVEIERIHAEKKRLEQERDDMLREKAFLERQLREAGVDLTDFSENNSTTIEKQPPPLTLEQVLKESFRELFQRVRRDIQFVGSVLDPVLRPVFGAVNLVWRHTSPTLGAIVRTAISTVTKVSMNPMVRSAAAAAWKLIGAALELARTRVNLWIKPLTDNPKVKALGAALKPVGGILRSLWRIAKPLLEKARDRILEWFKKQTEPTAPTQQKEIA